MKNYVIEWTFQGFSGEMTIPASSSKEAMKTIRQNYPGFEVESFSIIY